MENYVLWDFPTLFLEGWTGEMYILIVFISWLRNSPSEIFESSVSYIAFSYIVRKRPKQ